MYAVMQARVAELQQMIEGRKALLQTLLEEDKVFTFVASGHTGGT